MKTQAGTLAQPPLLPRTRADERRDVKRLIERALLKRRKGAELEGVRARAVDVGYRDGQGCPS